MMKDYTSYLKKEDYSKTTVVNYDRIRSLFISWCYSKGYEVEFVDYKTCIEYAKHLQQPKKGNILSKKTIKHQIGALKIYFNYLIDESCRGDNPMEHINIRGVQRSPNHNLLEYEELEDLFYSLPTRNIHFPSSPHVALRDKVITGLMVYQGLNATSLKSLLIEHINLERGKIYVPSTRKTNSRELEIKAPQILSLVQFMENSRLVLQESINCHTKAFIPLNGDRFDPIYRGVFKKLKTYNHKVTNTKQVRASVITYWLKSHNLREVQYMAGHRYISSTERYVQDDLESLQEVIESLHPIN